MHWIKLIQTERKHGSIATSAKRLMNHRGTQPMARVVECVGKLMTSSEYVEARAGMCQTMTKDTNQFMTHAKKMRKKRWQHKSLT